MARILIADDMPDNVKLLRLCLQDEGYEIVTATNGREAIEAAKRYPPDAILLDVMMPEMDGIEACRRLKQDDELRDIPIILVTALDQEADIVRGLDAGADDYVAKPFEERVIAAKTRGAVGRYQTATENRRLLVKLEQLATTDSLTGLLNRRTFFEHFNRELILANRHNTPLACVLMDIDFFKKINDDHGHPAGDATLTSFAAILPPLCRSTDFLCRYGGEEFIALLTQTDEKNAAAWAEHVRSAVSELAIPTAKGEIKITSSFGVAGRYGNSSKLNDMLEGADQSLLVAKRSGRNRVVVFSELAEDSALQASLSGDPNHALHGVLAKEVMSQVSSVKMDATLREAVDVLIQYKSNAVPVINTDGIVVGVVSEKDIMVSSSDGHLSDRVVEDHMSLNAVKYNENDSAQSVYDFFCRNALRRVVVVNDNRPVGVISRSDLLRWIYRQEVMASSQC